MNRLLSEQRIKLNIDDVCFLEKPEGKYVIGGIRNRLAKGTREIPVRDLIAHIEMGGSFTPAAMSGTKGGSWQSQQIIVADIDNDKPSVDEDGKEMEGVKIPVDNPLSSEEALHRCKENGIEPTFIYHTFRNSDALEKSRIVCVLDEPVESAEEGAELTNRLSELLEKEHDGALDYSMADPARLIFGSTKGSVFYTGDALTSIEAFRALPQSSRQSATSIQSNRIEREVSEFIMPSRTELEYINLHNKASWFKDWSAKHNIPILRSVELGDGGMIYAVDCPWSNKHSEDTGERQSAVMISSAGVIGYKCMHSHCSDKHWKDYRAFYEGKNLSTVKNGIIYPVAKTHDDNIAHLNPITAYELDAVEMPPINWIVKGLIAKGNVIIFGAPSKYFKSYLVLGQMAAISEGRSYLGFDSSQCECLYFDLESTRRRPKERLNQILGADSVKPKGLHIITGADNAVSCIGKGFEEQLSEVLDLNPNIGLVAIDVFGKIRTSKGKQDQYEYDYKDVSALKSLANKYDVAIILVHHTTKMKRSDPFDAITGSVGLVGAVDCAWTITKDNRAATEGVFHVTGRDIDTMEISVRFNKDTFTWERLGTREEIEYQQLLSDYEKSNVVKTLFSVMTIPGRWDSSAEDLIKASYRNNTHIGEDARTVGIELSRFKDLLEMEGITFTKQRTSKGMRYTFIRAFNRE